MQRGYTLQCVCVFLYVLWQSPTSSQPELVVGFDGAELTQAQAWEATLALLGMQSRG